MSADEFHEQSLKITIPLIKRALKHRFRNEQIARLGNTHIIYPAFNEETFKEIIRLELKKIAVKIYQQQNIEIDFAQSVHDLIYREGVYPTQGTRPIFTTIHQIINTKLGKMITEMVLHNIKASKVEFKAGESSVIIEYQTREETIHILELEQVLNLEKLRKSKKDDMQAITAVHEAGHAIISMLLLHTIPEVIFSNTVDVGNSGFVYTKFKWKYISRKEIKNRLALFLAGYAAEKLIFSENYITTGAEEDIREATEFATQMLKRCGMGSIQGAYHNQEAETRFYLYDETNNINKEAERWLESAKQLAEETLKEQELLLLKMADYLSDNRRMTKNQIRHILIKYVVNYNISELIENGDHLYYRNHLKNKVLSLNEVITSNTTSGTCEFSLNKNQNHEQNKKIR